jgi:electron transfer flavoprotein beta subunit
LKIAVLVKEVPDTWGERIIDPVTKRVVRTDGVVTDEISEKAVEAALLVKEANHGSEVTVVTMGPSHAIETIRRCLAMGADNAIHVLDDDLAGSDLIQTSAALSSVISSHQFDLVIAGNESTDGRAGVLPAMIAEGLGFAQLTFLRTLEVIGELATGERVTSDGHVRVTASLPAVVSVTEQIAEARYPNFKGIMAAKKKPVLTASAADLGLPSDSVGEANSSSVVDSVTPRPQRSSGVIVTDDGTAARQLFDYLAAAKLI